MKRTEEWLRTVYRRKCQANKQTEQQSQWKTILGQDKTFFKYYKRWLIIMCKLIPKKMLKGKKKVNILKFFQIQFIKANWETTAQKINLKQIKTGFLNAVYWLVGEYNPLLTFSQ